MKQSLAENDLPNITLEIQNKFLVNFCKTGTATGIILAIILLLLKFPFHDCLIVGFGGVYYLFIYILQLNVAFIKKHLATLVVYGVFPIIFYTIYDPSLSNTSQSFLFFLPFIAFFSLGRKKGTFAVALYITGIIAIYFYTQLGQASVYSDEQKILSIAGIILTSVIGYIVSSSRSKIEDLYKDESKKYHNYKLAVSQATNHIILTDVNGKILFTNEAAERITGYKSSEMSGQTPRLWGGLQTPQYYKNLWKTIKTDKKQFSGTIQNRRKNGEIYTAIVHIAPILDENQKIIGFIGAEEDISQRVDLENRLEGEKIRDDALLESLGEGVIAQDKDKKVIFVNRAATQMLGYDAKELIGKSFVDIIHALNKENEEISNANRPLTKVSFTRSRWIDQLTYVRKDKTTFESEVVITPVYVGEKYYGDIQVFKDITKEKEIDRAKTEFISLASHQLRTPLSSIRWFTEILLEGDEGQLSEKQKEVLNNVYKSTLRMIELISALLNISRIESGRIMVEPEQIDLKELIADVITDILAKVNEKNQNIVMNIAEDIPKVFVDKKLISNVFMNLLTNSIKYSPDDGEIKVNVVKKDDTLLCSVEDKGYGIPASQQDQIFNKFFRGENIVKIVTDGTGLGLYLVKSIIDSSGGKIWFESKEGQGTTFFFTIPLSGMREKKGEVTLDS